MLMNALSVRRPPFEILVLMDQSRLGRSTREVPVALGKIFDSGIRVFTYLNDREIEGTTETDQFMLAAMAYVDGMQREQGRQRTHGCSATTTSRCSARPGSARTSSGVSTRTRPA